jgi:hypothetical protein
MEETRECPYCREDIKAEAIKCKHCGSSVTPERPAHEGICPFCKEQIHREAIKCKHCKTVLNAETGSDCGCGESELVSGAPDPMTRASLRGGFQPEVAPGAMALDMGFPAGVALMVGGGGGGGGLGFGCRPGLVCRKYCGCMYGYCRCSWVCEEGWVCPRIV